MLSNPSEDAIKISTIHRAKGLENDRVFILEYDKLPPPRDLEWENIQERNLHYVAVTRPKEELYLCASQLQTDSEEPDEDAQPATPVNVADVLPTPVDIPVKEAEGLIKVEQEKNSIEANPFGEQIEKVEEEDTQEFLDALASITPQGLGLSINIRPIQAIKKVPEKFYAFDEQEATPFTSLALPCQKAKYWSVYNNLQETEFSIANVVSLQYQDVYYINTPNGIEVYGGYYKKSGQYTFTPQGNCINAEQVMCYLEDESNYKIKFEYNPMNDGFEAVHQLIQAECQEQSICNTNIYSESFALVYCFKTSCSYAYIKLSYNGRKIITGIAPFSTLGDGDEKLKTILESLKHLWQG